MDHIDVIAHKRRAEIVDGEGLGNCEVVLRESESLKQTSKTDRRLGKQQIAFRFATAIRPVLADLVAGISGRVSVF